MTTTSAQISQKRNDVLADLGGFPANALHQVACTIDRHPGGMSAHWGDVITQAFSLEVPLHLLGRGIDAERAGANGVAQVGR